MIKSREDPFERCRDQRVVGLTDDGVAGFQCRDFGLKVIEAALCADRRRRHLDCHQFFKAQRSVSTCSARRCLADFLQTCVGQEVVAKKLCACDAWFGTACNEAMRAEAANISWLGNGYRAFPGEYVGKK